MLFEPTKYDDFYNMALKQETAQLKCEASKKRVRDAVQSSSSSLVAAKQQKFWLPPPPPFRQPYQQKNKGAMVLPTLAIRTSLRIKLQSPMLLIIVHSQR